MNIFRAGFLVNKNNDFLEGLRPATIRNISILVVERSISQNIRNLSVRSFIFFKLWLKSPPGSSIYH